MMPDMQCCFRAKACSDRCMAYRNDDCIIILMGVYGKQNIQEQQDKALAYIIHGK